MPESTDAGTSTDAASQTTTTDQQQQNGNNSDQLGDAGKRALDAERAARQTADRARKAAEKELETLRSQSMSDAEKAVAAAKAEGRSEALTAANERLVKAEVRIAAAGKLADPADAVRFLDLADFKVDADGEVDAKAVAKAIDQLVKDRPYLAAGTTKVQGSGDGGARGTSQTGVSMNDLLRQAAGRAPTRQ